jgi:hypothetical protein
MKMSVVIRHIKETEGLIVKASVASVCSGNKAEREYPAPQREDPAPQRDPIKGKKRKRESKDTDAGKDTKDADSKR